MRVYDKCIFSKVSSLKTFSSNSEWCRASLKLTSSFAPSSCRPCLTAKAENAIGNNDEFLNDFSGLSDTFAIALTDDYRHPGAFAGELDITFVQISRLCPSITFPFSPLPSSQAVSR